MQRHKLLRTKVLQDSLPGAFLVRQTQLIDMRVGLMILYKILHKLFGRDISQRVLTIRNHSHPILIFVRKAGTLSGALQVLNLVWQASSTPSKVRQRQKCLRSQTPQLTEARDKLRPKKVFISKGSASSFPSSANIISYSIPRTWTNPIKLYGNSNLHFGGISQGVLAVATTSNLANICQY